ncbi:hypothetical protein D7X96_00560 [Corallococcus interemptor]|uniref:Uncharacterized protein n=1 Tax=Corallococcus interemptor TaxID=2316720 RepID=A0A3A8QZS5_9BACT|nr:hypothetical protein [Corallococcus interemptor]RKH74087.1 hypothetical protein D7X96_00560 [Corallococcus interemptor]
MLKLIRYILEGNALEALGILLLVLLVRWVFSLLTESNSSHLPHATSDTLLGAHAPEAPTLAPPEVAEAPSSPVPMLLGLGLLLAVLVMGGILLIGQGGSGSLHIVTHTEDPDRDINLRVDNEPVAPVLHDGQHLVYPIPTGPHEIYLRVSSVGVSRNFRADIQRGDALMLSVHPDMCAVQIDMSTLTYGRPPSSSPTRMDGVHVRTLPVVTRFTNTASPLRIPADAFLSFNELPEQLPPQGTASILTPLPCAQAQDDRSTWTAVRELHVGLKDAAQRVGYTEEDPTRGEVSAMDDSHLLDLHQRQGAALARETPP